MPPDVVQVDYRKYDGSPHRSYPALRLGEDEHGVWLGVPQDTFSGESFKYEDPYVLLVPHSAWYTAMFNAPPRRTEVYCDITTPANWPSAERRGLVGLALDVRRRRAPGDAVREREGGRVPPAVPAGTAGDGLWRQGRYDP